MDSASKETREYYEKHAQGWMKRKTDSFMLERQVRRFSWFLGGRGNILDIGCAGGIHVPLFLGIGRKMRYEGIDVSQSMVRIAKSRYPQLSFSKMDVSSPSFAMGREGKFDGIWASAVLMHVPKERWGSMLEGIEEVMTRGGVIYLSVPRKRFARKEDLRHFSVFTTRDIAALLRKWGWKILAKGDFGTENGKWVWYIARAGKVRVH